MNKENKNALDELNKGCSMGIDAINDIMDDVSDKKLKRELNRQIKKYREISEKVNACYNEVSGGSPKETNAMNKTMTYYGIKMRTMMDRSTSHLAELLLQGTNMGIIEGRKLLNNKDIDKKYHSLIVEYVDMQEEAVEKLKAFL